MRRHGIACAALAVSFVAACSSSGGTPSGPASSASQTEQAAPAAPIASTGSSVEAAPTTAASAEAVGDVQTTGLEAQSVGLDVAGYSVKHNFSVPANQKQFETKVPHKAKLRPGSKAGYRVVAQKHFLVCVTYFVDGKPSNWSIYDSKTGAYNGKTGSPTDASCPKR